jgi:hypothetical protein
MVQSHSEEKDERHGFKIHYFKIKQIHGKFDLIMDWQYKVRTGKDPTWIK